MEITEKVAVREQAVLEYDKFLIDEIKHLIDLSKTDKWINDNGQMFSAGVRFGLDQVLQMIDNFEINN